MPCYNLSGNLIPGTAQTCASLGGTWAVGEVPVVPPTPNIGNIGKTYKMGEGVQRSHLNPGLGFPNTNNFGQPVSTNFAGDSLFDMKQKRQNIRDEMEFTDRKINTQPTINPEFDAPAQGIGDLVQGFLPSKEDLKFLYKAVTDPVERDRVWAYMKENPGTSVLAALTAVGVGKKLKQFIPKPKRYTGKKGQPEVKPHIVKGEVVNANKVQPYIAAVRPKSFIKDVAVVGGGTVLADKVYTEQTGESFIANALGLGDKNNDLIRTNVPTPTTPTNNIGPLNAKGEFQKSDPERKKKDFDWDKLSKLGQLMAHFGTPLSKRGDHPNVQWGKDKTAALTALAKLQTSPFAKTKDSTVESQFKGFLTAPERDWNPFTLAKSEAEVDSIASQSAILYKEYVGRGMTHGEALAAVRKKYGY